MNAKITFIASLLLACATGCSPKTAETTQDPADPVMMLRLRITNTLTDEAWARLYSGLQQNPRCCDEIWFSTGITMPVMDVHRQHVERLLRAKEDLKALGIGTSVQFQMTIGHGDTLSSAEEWEAKTWTGWTGSTGVEAKCCNCPRQEGLLEYMREMARMYAQVKPRVMWIDDDLRYDNHYPATVNSRIGCWCETCLADFSEREGVRWTRESLDKAMAADKDLEERWKAFNIESLDRIARVIAEETHAVSPETKMGYQKTFSDRDTTVIRTILKTLAEVSGQKVCYRAGGGAYYDKYHPADQIIKSMSSARYMRVLGCEDIIDSWCPEIETHPRHYGSRTGQGVLLEGFAALAYGLDAVSMFVLDNGEESIEVQSRSMLRPLHEGSEVLHQYVRANKGTITAGYVVNAGTGDLFTLGLRGVPVLPGKGKCLAKLEEKEVKAVNIYNQPSSVIQAFRDRLDAAGAAPACCISPFIGQVIPRVDGDGTLRTLGLINCRIDAQSCIRFRLPALREDVKTVCWRELRKDAVMLKIERDEAGVAYVEVPEIGAWNAGFLDFT